jgi:hypothetical protein
MQIRNQNSINFTAIPRANYKLAGGENVRILEMETKDLPFIRNLSQNLEQYMDKREIETITGKRAIIDTAFKIIQEILEKIIKQRKKDNRTRLFVAECNSDICGVLVGGLPKRTAKGSIIHSSRGGAKKDETELNWLATWTPKANVQRNGVGKALMGEYADTFQKDGFHNAFIQSEIPSLSFAQKFYEKLGFKALSGQKPHSQVEKNKDIVHCVEEDYDYDIVPMLGNAEDVNNIKREIFSRYKRTELEHKSINLADNITC